MKQFSQIKLIALISLGCVFPFLANANTLFNQDAVDQYYLEREGEPIWVKNTRLSGDAKDLIEVLEGAWMNGLNPYKYHLEQIHSISADLRKSEPDERTMLELLLTDSYAEYFRDLSGMRVNASQIGLNANHWNKRVPAQKALSYLEKNRDDIDDFMHSLEPQTQSYKTLKAELTKLVEEGADSKVQVRFGETARPGRGYDDIPKLRERLGLEGVTNENRYKYDDTLVAAVQKFQNEHGLKPDGLIGKQTLFALNQNSDQKIKQIIVNMERLRWTPEIKPNRFIVVNIPSYTLWAIENGEVAFEMPVVVGRKKRETLSFVTEVHGVRFNPTWTVPKTIKKEDILPKLQEDPEYLAGKGMELYEGVGKDAITLDPTVVDWENVTQEDLAGFRMVQGSGANNPLGRIRVLMPNSHNIYLHDTNDKSLFARTDRAQSSGCIRMKNPEKIAQFILKTKSGWNDEKTLNVLNKGKMVDIYTNEKMPVYLLYNTAWLGSKGQVVYSSDIYGHDKELFQLLEKLDETPFFSDNKSKVRVVSQ
ncbi:MAG: L,D-transpeptidase family protein [Alphaproteobacteria bacterium]